MTRMRYVKMDRIMNHMLIHALREVFRQEKEQGLPAGGGALMLAALVRVL